MFHTSNTSFDLLLIVQYLALSIPLTSKRHLIYNVDSNTNSIQFKALIYFELQET